jgi:hypothetical protein
MTDQQKAAMQAALEVLERLQGGCTDSDDGTVEAITVWCPEVIDDLRAALAQQEQAEPVAYLLGTKSKPEWPYHSRTLVFADQKTVEGVAAADAHVARDDGQIHEAVPLYTSPPPCPSCESLARAVMMDQTGRA